VEINRGRSNNKLAMQHHSRQPEAEVEEEYKKKTNKITLSEEKKPFRSNGESLVKTFGQ
jgi:hypothetical protein